MSKTILITGSSSGIGLETAKHFQRQGWNVIATMRKPERADAELNTLENVLVTRLDVQDHESIKAAVDAGIARFGTIDAVLNNAGYGSYGVLEATPIEKIRRQYDVNVIGLLAVCKALLPHFRSKSDGTIINVSSMGGKVGMPLGTLYHGSKFAVEGMSESLAYELKPLGITVKIVEPGIIKTKFGESLDVNVDPSLTEYEPVVSTVMTAFANMGSQGSESSLVAETIFTAATDGTEQLRYVAGEDAAQFIAARKQMEDPEFINMMRNTFGL